MKKLMTAFAVCMVAGLVSATTGVESQNIVGYQTLDLNVGAFTHVSPTFITVGGAAQVTLSQLNGDMAETDSIQFIDPVSATAHEYFYLVAGSLSPATTGWYQDDFTTPADDVVIDAGTSVYYSSQGGTKVTFAGEVNKNAVVVDTGAGFTPVGNPFPVDTTLGTISFSGITETSSVQFMSDTTATAAEYFWLEAGSLSPGATGWYLDDFTTPAGDTVVAAGKGFLFSEQGTTTAVTFTSPL